MGTSRPARSWQSALALCLVATPALIFYLVLFRTAVNLPILDDYQIILGTANSICQTHGFLSRLAIALTSQHNGYKLVTNNLLVWAFYGLTGHIRFLPLIAIGDAFVLLIFLAIALMARPVANDLQTRLILLFPVACLVFQLQYASALNFASCTIQNVGVVAFLLVSIYFVSRATQLSFGFSCLCAVLAILSSPNGFFLAPLGALMLFQQRQWSRIAVWSGIFILMLVFYLYRYQGVPPDIYAASPADHSINPIYSLSFLGASVARYDSVLPAVLLGSVLCGVVVFAAAKRYYLQNPAVFYSMVFILINAVAVSGLRSGQGLTQSLASRYRIYSNLMLALTYIFLLEQLVFRWKNVVARRAAVATAMVLSILFCLLSDLTGARFLQAKKLALLQSYRVQWQGLPAEPTEQAELRGNPVLARQLRDGVYVLQLPTLRESARLGTYQPSP